MGDNEATTESGKGAANQGEGPRFLESARRPRIELEPTETIDLNSPFTRDLTSSGSFDLRDSPDASLDKLLHALPIPALLVSSGCGVTFANGACGSLVGKEDKSGHVPLGALLPDPKAAQRVQKLVHNVFATRKPEVSEALFRTDSIEIWARMNFRSLRIGSQRSVLLLVEDLTLEKKQLLLHQKHQEELQRSRDDLELRVEERTAELQSLNSRLLEEIEERKKAEDQLRTSVREKEVLLQEIHHRVKNNLNIISSLLALQSRVVEDEKVLGALKDSQSRVRSMAIIHEQLYQSGDLARIDFAGYLRDLTGALLRSYANSEAPVSFTVHADPVWFGIETAIPCGLIITELVSNCIKHAFTGDRPGEIRVGLHDEGQNRYLLTVTDNGKGLSERTDQRTSKSLGLRLVSELAQLQLRGTLEIRRDRGTEFRISFMAKEPLRGVDGKW